MFYTGCDPWYTTTSTPGPPWWFPGNSPPPGSCPDKNGILAQPNNQGQPWQCVVKAPGFSPAVIGDGIAAAIGNCANINNNSCNQYDVHEPELTTTPRTPTSGRSSSKPDRAPRVVFLFIVPYGAYKNTGPQDGAADPQLRRVLHHGLARPKRERAGKNPCEGTDP